MLEILEEVLAFLQANDLNTTLISIVISIIGVFIACFKTRKKSIQKKAGYVNLNSITLTDYVILYDNKIIPIETVKIKKITDITKLEKETYIDLGGVLNGSKKKDE